MSFNDTPRFLSFSLKLLLFSCVLLCAFPSRSIGIVSQEPTLFATTVGANIAYGKPTDAASHATNEEVEAAAKVRGHVGVGILRPVL